MMVCSLFSFKKSGPFIFLFGILISVGCRTTAQKEMDERLDTTFVDEIDFRQAPITEVIASLVDFSRQPDPDMTVLERKALYPNIMFLEPEREGEDPIVEHSLGCPSPLITVRLRQMNLREVLDTVCELQGLSYEVGRNGEIHIIFSKNDLNQLMDKTRLEEFDVVNLTLEQVIQSLAEQTCKLYVPKGMRILAKGPITKKDLKNTSDSDPFGIGRSYLLKPDFLELQISLKMKEATVREVLEAICKEGGLSFQVTSSGLVVLNPR